MCGFFATNDPSINENHLYDIKKRISFRGPDGESVLVEHQGWKLYHARLAIIAPNDLYNQPYLAEDGAIIVFNGEILNFKELANKYDIQNKDSDTHVLSNLLMIDSFNLNELEGFFAFVRIDAKGQLTHCARDRFGVKPLNYYKKANGLITISSEASAISDIYNISYNPKAIEEYEVFRAPIFQGTFFQDIQIVVPGSCLINGIYFDSLLFLPKEYKDINEIIDNIYKELDASIKSRMISDVPVGLLYSGGIDSNLINEFTIEPLTRFTGGFEGDYDVDHAKSHNIESNIVNVSNEEFIERFNSMIRLRKEPLSVPNEVILSFLAEAWSSQGGKVLLSGEAADELFGGYDRIYSWALSKEDIDVNEFLSLYAYLPIEDISESIKQDTSNFFTKLGSISVFEMVRQFFIKIHLPVLFRRLDFALMYAGVEGREPLASSMMFKVAMLCNPKDLFKHDLGKYPLRKVISSKMGSEFAYKPKVGFPIDLGEVFGGIKTENRYDNYSIWRKENLRRIL